MPYPHDPKLKGLAAATFHSSMHPHEIDHPCGADPQGDDYPPLPSWTIEKIRLGIMSDSVDVGRLPKPKLPSR